MESIINLSFKIKLKIKIALISLQIKNLYKFVNAEKKKKISYLFRKILKDYNKIYQKQKENIFMGPLEC